MNDQPADLDKAASILRLGLLAHGVTVAECVLWADSVIEASQKVPWWVLDLSLASAWSAADVVGIFSAASEQEASLSVYLGWLSIAVRRGHITEKSAARLAFFAPTANRPRPSASDVFGRLDDENEVAAQGVYGTVKEVAAEIVAELGKYESEPDLAPFLWLVDAS